MVRHVLHAALTCSHQLVALGTLRASMIMCSMRLVDLAVDGLGNLQGLSTVSSKPSRRASAPRGSQEPSATTNFPRIRTLGGQNLDGRYQLSSRSGDCYRRAACFAPLTRPASGEVLARWSWRSRDRPRRQRQGLGFSASVRSFTNGDVSIPATATISRASGLCGEHAQEQR